MPDNEESKRVAANDSGCGLCWFGFMVYSNASDLTFLPSNRHLIFILFYCLFISEARAVFVISEALALECCMRVERLTSLVKCTYSTYQLYNC